MTAAEPTGERIAKATAAIGGRCRADTTRQLAGPDAGGVETEDRAASSASTARRAGSVLTAGLLSHTHWLPVRPSRSVKRSLSILMSVGDRGP
jgi:hypothetical protein